MTIKEFFAKIKLIFSRLPFPIPVIIGILFFLQPIPFLKPLGFFVFFFAFAFSPKRMRRRQGFFDFNKDIQNEEVKDDYIEKEFKLDKSYYKEIKVNQDLLDKIKNYINKKNISKDLKGIDVKLENEIENSKKSAEKIDLIEEALKNMKWNLQTINQKILEEKNLKSDEKRINKFIDMKNNIIELHSRKEKLLNQINDISLNFQTIYTKLTLLDLENHPAFDEIETEIQRILDHKLKVSKYEEKIDEDLKNYL